MTHFIAATRVSSSRLKPSVVAVVLLVSLLSGCAPLILGGMVGGSLVAADRRTGGAQLEDQAIEIKARGRIKDIMGERDAPSVASYNRVILLVGGVPTEADKSNIDQAVSRIPNVRSVVNEISIQSINVSTGLSDAVLTSKVKATLFDAKDLQVAAFKVVSNNGVVYLMGRVTEREANRSSDLTRSISGVKKVVRVFEIVTDAELIDMMPGQPPVSAPAQ